MMNFSLKSSKPSLVRVVSIAGLLGLLISACHDTSANSTIQQPSPEAEVTAQPQGQPSNSTIQQPSPSPEVTAQPQGQPFPNPREPANIPTSPSPSPTRLGTTSTNNQTAEAKIDAPQFCELNQAIVADPDPPLNIRNQPNAATGLVIATVDNGRFLGVKDEKDGWLQVTYKIGEEELSGWVAKNRTETNCNYKKQQITFPGGEGLVEIRDRHIGGGSHEYIFSATAGQTLTVTAKNGPLPFIFAPNDPNRQQDLSGGGHYSSQTNVTVELAATGNYLLMFDSNFKGYEYDVLVELR
jgi:hypothetical protein